MTTGFCSIVVITSNALELPRPFSLCLVLCWVFWFNVCSNVLELMFVGRFHRAPLCASVPSWAYLGGFAEVVQSPFWILVSLALCFWCIIWKLLAHSSHWVSSNWAAHCLCVGTRPGLVVPELRTDWLCCIVPWICACWIRVIKGCMHRPVFHQKKLFVSAGCAHVWKNGCSLL